MSHGKYSNSGEKVLFEDVLMVFLVPSYGLDVTALQLERPASCPVSMWYDLLPLSHAWMTWKPKIWIQYLTESLCSSTTSNHLLSRN